VTSSFLQQNVAYLILISVAGPEPELHGSALIFVGGIRIRIGFADPDPGGQKDSHKRKNFINFMLKSAGCYLLRAEGASTIDWTFFILWINFLSKKFEFFQP
jgi:hypothetical protein